MTDAAMTANRGNNLGPLSTARAWPDSGHWRVPNWIYTDPEIFARESELVFGANDWLYVCLEAEIPDPGNFKRSQLGMRDVVAVRDRNGAINVFLNRCAHRGMQVCAASHGSVKEFVCPYHQWTYDRAGNLLGVPFQRGYRGQGGMPEDFRKEEHPHVAGLSGLISARAGVALLPWQWHPGILDKQESLPTSRPPA